MRFYLSGKLPNQHKRTLEKFAASLAKELSLSQDPRETCIIFMNDNEIKAINRKFLNHNFATDVITFPYEPQKRASILSQDQPFGDIYISVDTARKQAQKGNYPLRQELALLVAHGFLHLLGYKDYSPRQRARMFAKQKTLLSAINPKLAPPDL